MKTDTTKQFPEDYSDLYEDSEALLKKYKKEALEKCLLLDVSKKISSSLNVKEVLNLIINSVNQVIPYDAAGIFLVEDETQNIYPAVMKGYDRKAFQKARLKVGRGLVGVVTREGKGLVCPDVSKESRYVDIRKHTCSEIVVPLEVRDKLIGALNLESDRIHAFTEGHLQLLTAFASHAAIAIDNARLHEQVLKNKELEFDLITARKIQKAILPKVLPEIDGYEFATLNIPSKTVSGDLYDLTRLNNGRVGLAIGDVSGKGTPAAILMSSIFSSYKRIINEPISVAERLDRLNKIIYGNVLAGTYTTLFYSELDIKNRKLIYCNAGHFPPIIIGRNREPQELSEGGMILGFLKDADYEQAEVDLYPGDVLLMYTDGLNEARNQKGELFNSDKIVELLKQNRHASAEELKKIMLSQIRQFVRKSYFDDDLTFVILKVTESK